MTLVGREKERRDGEGERMEADGGCGRSGGTTVAMTSVAAVTREGRGCINVECTLPEHGFIANNCADLIRILAYRNRGSVLQAIETSGLGCRANINLNGFSTPLSAARCSRINEGTVQLRFPEIFSAFSTRLYEHNAPTMENRIPRGLNNENFPPFSGQL